MMMERTTRYGTDTVMVISSQDENEERKAPGAKVILWRYLLGVACVLGIAGGYTLMTLPRHGNSSYEDYWTYSSSTFVATESSSMVDLRATTSSERAGKVPPTIDHHHQHRSLLLLRHAKSSWENANRLPDEERPLLARGMEDAKRLGIYLKQHHVPVPDIIFASPSVRTKQTLHLVQRHWAHDVPVQYLHELFDDALASSSYIDIIRHSLDPAYHRVLLVGHNPAIQATALQLVGVKQDAFAPADVDDDGVLQDEVLLVDFPTAGLVEIEWRNNENKQVVHHHHHHHHLVEEDQGWDAVVHRGNGRVTMFVTPAMT
jgi:phosphohistidine phosphatase